MSITPAVAWLHRFRVPRGLGAALLVTAIFAMFNDTVEFFNLILERV